MKRKAKVQDLLQSTILQPGTKLTPFYNCIELVNAAIQTVRDVLIEGIVLVILVFFSSRATYRAPSL